MHLQSIVDRQKFQEYYESKVWQCLESPTGAHWRVCVPYDPKERYIVMVCKYCENVQVIWPYKGARYFENLREFVKEAYDGLKYKKPAKAVPSDGKEQGLVEDKKAHWRAFSLGSRRGVRSS